MKKLKGIKLFAARHSIPFGQQVAKHLGIKLGKVNILNFSDEEIYVKYLENLRGKDVFIICSTNPPADHLMELLIMIDAAKRASARSVTVVIPYFGNARQDRKDAPRVSITAKLIANLITTAGASRVITMDLHAPQIQGFFDIPVDNLYASSKILIPYWKKLKIPDLAVAALDAGSSKMARFWANELNAKLIMVDKRRKKANQIERNPQIIGNAKGCNIITPDDLMDTAGTFKTGVKTLKAAGAKNIYGAFTHLLCSGKAYKRILELQKECNLKQIIGTDSIPHDDKMPNIIKVLSATKLFAEAILRVATNKSISSIFKDGERR
jgi:ribose-phosphate pyrophosphokinase